MATDDLEIVELLKDEYTSCSLCSGYYSNNYGHAICSTCHFFMFPDETAESDDDTTQEKADSEDSGNEEPESVDDFYSQDEPHSQERRNNPLHRADKLADRVTSLSVFRAEDVRKVPAGLVDSLPTEVLLVIFKWMDDLALYHASCVSTRWRQILEDEMGQNEWERFVRLRWPLFQPMYCVKRWKEVYSKLLQSAPCKICVENIMLQSPSPIDENSWRHRRLRSELRTLTSDPPQGIQAVPLDKHCCQWQAVITGPSGSPYEGGAFYIYLQIPSSYPLRPPIARFLTKIFHPNISRHGDIGLDSLYHNWSLALTISKVLISIQSLLTDPYTYTSMEPAISRMYERNRFEFNRLARKYTWKYAMHDYLTPSEVQFCDESDDVTTGRGLTNGSPGIRV